MRDHYFKVGEEVILNSSTNPEWNGEYVVEAVLLKGDKHKGAVLDIALENVFYYDLGFMTPNFPVYTCWQEKSLRKKYPPSSEGFHDMMTKIKDNVLEGVE